MHIPAPALNFEPTSTLQSTPTLEPTPETATVAPTSTTPASTTAEPATVTSAAATSTAPAARIATIPTDPDALAAHLAGVAPSVSILDELEFDCLSPAGRLDALVAWERQVRHANAGLIRCLGALARDTTVEAWLVETEVCAALAWSPSTAQSRLADADALTRLFPDTLQHLADGRISAEQARSLPQLTFGLNDKTAQAVEAHVLPRMPGQSVSATRQALRRAILRTDPHAAAQRHRHERERRRVELHPEDDGMATLSFYLPADVAQMAMRTLTALAQQAKRKNSGDKRTLDQRRADLLPAVLNGAATTTALVPARVTVVASIETLLGLSHEPGHLDGYGPICPEQTRRIAHAHAARWRFLLTATDGTPVQASPTYTPTAAIKHLTTLKHTTCAFPHCAMPADRCDLDHNLAYGKGGPTAVGNLAPLCRRHHNGKTHGHWQLDRRDDTITWTSKQTGRTYTTTGTRYQPAPVAA